MSVPSPSPYDTVIAKEIDGTRIKIDDEWKWVQKRYYVQHDVDLFVRFKLEYKNLIEVHMGSLNKIQIDCFKKYRPKHIYKTDTLTQFACDNCVAFDYSRSALKKGSSKVHKCGTKACPNYDNHMGDTCNCMYCKNCKIFELLSYNNDDLCDKLRCDAGSDLPLLI